MKCVSACFVPERLLPNRPMLLLISAFLWCMFPLVTVGFCSRAHVLRCRFSWTQFVSEVRTVFMCWAPSCYVGEPGQIKVVAIDTGAGLVRVNPEGGGIVVATVRPEIKVQQDNDLIVYQSTKQIRIAGSGFEHVTEASEVVLTPVNVGTDT